MMFLAVAFRYRVDVSFGLVCQSLYPTVATVNSASNIAELDRHTPSSLAKMSQTPL